jgi:hypothetical protein
VTYATTAQSGELRRQFSIAVVKSVLHSGADIRDDDDNVGFGPTPEMATGCCPRSTITRPIKTSPR